RYFGVSNGSGLSGSVQLQTDQIGTDVTTLAAASSMLMPSRARAALTAQGVSLREAVAEAPLNASAITGQRGWNLERPSRSFRANAEGRVTIQSEEVDRLELHLSEGSGHQYSGYLRVGDGLAPLPIGSTLNASTGVFTWAPGVGFVGPYDFVFVRWA